MGGNGNGWVSDCLNKLSYISQRTIACEGRVLTWESGYWSIKFNQPIFIQHFLFIWLPFRLIIGNTEYRGSAFVEFLSDSRGREAMINQGEWSSRTEGYDCLNGSSSGRRML